MVEAIIENGKKVKKLKTEKQELKVLLWDKVF